MTRRPTRALVALLLSAGLLAGCSDGDDDSGRESRDDMVLVRGTAVSGTSQQGRYLWIGLRTGHLELVELPAVSNIGIQGEFLVDASREWAAPTSSLDRNVLEDGKLPITNLRNGDEKELDLFALTDSQNLDGLAAWFDQAEPGRLHIGDGEVGWLVDVENETAVVESGTLLPTGGDLEAGLKERTGSSLIQLDTEQWVAHKKVPDPGCFYEDLAYVDPEGTTVAFCRNRDKPEELWIITLPQGAEKWEKGPDLKPGRFIDFFDLLIPPAG